MKPRAILGLTLAAGLASAASAQENVNYTWTFVEVTMGTNNPVANPNGLIEPGECARLELTVNITPGIGSTTTYTPPPPPGTGTIAGLGSIFFDLTGTGSAQGTWAFLSRATGFALGSAGTPSGTGEAVTAAQAGQFILPGSTANSSNPVNAIWRGVWCPTSYTNRTVTFTSMAAAAGGNNHSSILIQYGVDPDGNPQYIGKFVSATFGSVNIPVVPGPSSLALLGLGAVIAGRRRR
jgi:hypothetical protein